MGGRLDPRRCRQARAGCPAPPARGSVGEATRSGTPAGGCPPPATRALGAGALPRRGEAARRRRRVGPVAGGGGPDTERQDDRPGGARDPRVARPRRSRQREGRPGPRHARGAVHAGAGCGASTPPAAAGCPRAPGRRSPCAATGARRGGWRRICASRRGPTPRLPTASSGTPSPPSCWAPSSWPPRSTVARWPTWCAGSTPRRWVRSPPSSNAPLRPRRSPRRRRRGAVTSGHAARSTPRRRPCSPRSPTRQPGAARAPRSSRLACSAERTRCTCVLPPMTSAGYGATSPRSPAGAGARLRHRGEDGSPARPTPAGGARRDGAHRAAARTRRPGRHVRLARDPDRHGVAGPGPGERALRGAGAHRAQQPPGQAVPARDRRPGHARLRQPARRRRGGLPPLGDPGPGGPALDHVDDRVAAAAPPRGAPLPAPGAGPCSSTAPCRRRACTCGPGGRGRGRGRGAARPDGRGPPGPDSAGRS